MTFEAARPWCYGEMFPSLRAAWDAHDKACESLRHFWAGRPGGVTAFGDTDTCGDCGVSFHVEGLFDPFWDDATVDAGHPCACCARRRGLPVPASVSRPVEPTGRLVEVQELD